MKYARLPSSLPITTPGALPFTSLFKVVPMAASLEVAAQRVPVNSLQPGAVRLFLVLFCIEAGSLAIKYI